MTPELEDLRNEIIWLLVGYYNDKGELPDLRKLEIMANRALIEGGLL